MDGGLGGGIITLLLILIIVPRLTRGSAQRAKQQRAEGNTHWWNADWARTSTGPDAPTSHKVITGLSVFLVTVLVLESDIHPAQSWALIGCGLVVLIVMISLHAWWARDRHR